MRRHASGIVLVVVAAIALAAALDAVRKGGEPDPAAAVPTLSPTGGPILTGALLWTDDRCRLHTTFLPSLQEPDRARRVECGLRLSPAGELLGGSEGSDAEPQFALGAGDAWPRNIGVSILDMIESTATSPSGTMLAAATRGGVLLVKDGAPRILPISDAAGFAWSPDERWLATAGESEVSVVRLVGRELRIHRLPIAAKQLAWVSGRPG